MWVKKTQCLCGFFALAAPPLYIEWRAVSKSPDGGPLQSGSSDAYQSAADPVAFEAMSFDLKRALAAHTEGKALGPHPAFMDRSVPVSVYSPGAPRQDAVLSQREAA